MQPFSGYLPEELSTIPFGSLTPAERQRIVRAYARRFNLTDQEAAGALKRIAKATKSKDNPQGVLPSTLNLAQKDVFEDAVRRPKRSDIVLGLLDHGMANIGGANNVIPPIAQSIAMPTLTAAGYPADALYHAGKWAYGLTGNEIPADIDPLAQLGLSLGLWHPSQHLIRGRLQWLGNKIVPGRGGFFADPWSRALKTKAGKKLMGKALASKIPMAAGALGSAGSALDVASTVANTGYDAYDNVTGQKAKRYTEAARNTIGHNANPWEAAADYQGKRFTDVGLDTAKLAWQLASKGHTGGMVSMLGGTRLHTDLIPGLPTYDPLLMGKTNKQILWDAALKPTLAGRIARRKLKYRYRDGFGSGLGKHLAGEYFNYEHGDVDRKIAQERLDFRRMADFATMADNPKLALKIFRTKDASPTEKALLRERNKWMKDAGIYESTAKKVDADTGTLE